MRERAKRGCGWRASHRGQEQETSIVCTSHPQKIVAVAVAADDGAVVAELSWSPWGFSDAHLSCHPLALAFGLWFPSSSPRLGMEELESPWFLPHSLQAH